MVQSTLNSEVARIPEHCTPKKQSSNSHYHEHDWPLRLCTATQHRRLSNSAQLGRVAPSDAKQRTVCVIRECHLSPDRSARSNSMLTRSTAKAWQPAHRTVRLTSVRASAGRTIVALQTCGISTQHVHLSTYMRCQHCYSLSVSWCHCFVSRLGEVRTFPPEFLGL